MFLGNISMKLRQSRILLNALSCSKSKRCYSVSPQLINTLYDHRNLSYKLFSTVDDALNFYIQQYRLIKDPLAAAETNKSQPDQINNELLENKQYFDNAIILKQINIENSLVDRNTLQVKNSRKQLEKLQLTKVNDQIAYSLFLAFLYQLSQKPAWHNIRRYTKSIADKDFAELKQYFDLFEAYLKLPEPRPDYIKHQHLEDFIDAFMRLDTRFFKHNKKVLQKNHVWAFYNVLNDLLKSKIELTIKEKNHLMYLQLFMLTRSFSRVEQKRIRSDIEKNKNKLLDDYEALAGKKDTDISSINIFLKNAIKSDHTKLIHKIIEDYFQPNAFPNESATEPEEAELMEGSFSERSTIAAATAANIAQLHQVDRFSLASLLKYLSANNDSETFEKVLSAIPSSNITLDVPLSSSIIHGLLQLNDVKSAQLIFKHLLEMAIAYYRSPESRLEMGQTNVLQHYRLINKKIKDLDLLRFVVSKQKKVEINSQPLQFYLRPNHNMISTHLKFFGGSPGYDFKEIVKLLLLLENEFSKKAELITLFNELHPGKQELIYQDIYPGYSGEAVMFAAEGETLALHTIDYNNILEGFLANNLQNTGSSWNLPHLQFITKVYLQNVERENVQVNYSNVQKFLESYIAVLKSGNIRPGFEIDEDVVLDNANVAYSTAQSLSFRDVFGASEEMQKNHSPKFAEGLPKTGDEGNVKEPAANEEIEEEFFSMSSFIGVESSDSKKGATVEVRLGKLIAYLQKLQSHLQMIEESVGRKERAAEDRMLNDVVADIELTAEAESITAVNFARFLLTKLSNLRLEK